MTPSPRVLITFNPEHTRPSHNQHLQRWLTYVRLLKKSGLNVFYDNSLTITDSEWKQLTVPFVVQSPRKKEKGISILSKLFSINKKEEQSPGEREEFALILREHAQELTAIAPIQFEFMYHPTPVTPSEIAPDSSKVLIVNSMYLKKWAIDNLKRDSTSIEVIYPFFDRDKFHSKDKTLIRTTARAKLNLTASDFAVGFSVQNGQSKSEIRSKEVDELDKSLLEGGLCKTLVFDSNKVSLQEYYHSLDLFVAPEALAYFDNSILEAMACGLPIFANAKAAAAEVLPSKQCIFNYDSAEQWRDRIHSASKMLDWLVAIGRQNSERSPLFDENHHLKRFIEVLNRYGIEVN